MNELAVVPRDARAAGLPAVTGPPGPQEWQALKQQAAVIAKSGLAPKAVSSPEKILVIALKGRELSIPPMQALSHVHIVEGKPTLSAELMAALVQRAGHKLRVLETTAERCEVVGVRSDDPAHASRASFDMEDARRAGVASKAVWKQYPAAMLRARAISALCRFAFADVLMGAAFTPEELGADVDGEGQIVEGDAGTFPKGGPMFPSDRERLAELSAMTEGEETGDASDAIPGEPIDATSPGFDPEHDRWRTEVERVYYRIPVDARPAYGKVQRAADRGTRAAKEALRRLRVLAAEAGTLPANSLDPDKDYSDGEAGAAGEEEAQDAG